MMHPSSKGLTLVGRSVPRGQATHVLHPSNTEASVSTVMSYYECQGSGKARHSGLPMEREMPALSDHKPVGRGFSFYFLYFLPWNRGVHTN